MKPLTILFAYALPFHPERGGIERVTDLLARELRHRGHRILYLTGPSGEGYADYAPPASVYYLPDAGLKSPRNVTFYHQFIREHKVDVIINQMGLWKHSTLFTRPLQDDGSWPVTISVLHSMPLLEYDWLWDELFTRKSWSLSRFPRTVQRLLTFPLYRMSYKRKRGRELSAVINSSHAVCTLSACYLKTMEDMGLFRKTRCVGAAIANPCAIAPRSVVPAKKKQIIYVGRLDALHKGAHRLAGIWSQLCERYPDWEFLIVGDGPIRDTMEEQAASLPRIRFLGFCNPEPYLQDAAILCLTSSVEGFGLVLVEAMSLGTVPVAFHSFPVLPELLGEDMKTLAVTPFNMSEYVQKVDFLMSNEEERQAHAERALKRAAAYSLSTIVDHWEGLIEQASQSRQSELREE